MAEIIRQRVLRRMDAQVGQGRGDPEHIATMLRYYSHERPVRRREMDARRD